MALLMYATEIEILNELVPADRAALFEEAAKGYRARANVRRELGKAGEAQMDQERAVKLVAEAAKIQKATVPAKDRDKTKTAKTAVTGRIRLINAWTQPVSVIVDGTPYYLVAGEQKDLNRPEGAFTYETPILKQRVTGTVEAGITYTIRIRARQ
jgi:hypothetical protein